MSITFTQPKSSTGHSRYPRWTMADGTKIRIEDMDDQHLTNALRALERGAKEAYPAVAQGYLAVVDMMGGPQGGWDPDIDDDDGWDAILPNAYYDLIAEAERRGLAIEREDV